MNYKNMSLVDVLDIVDLRKSRKIGRATTIIHRQITDQLLSHIQESSKEEYRQMLIDNLRAQDMEKKTT